MTSFRRALLYGFLVWLIPFLVAFLIFPLRESSRPLFESIMPVTLAMATAVFGVLYFKNLASNHVRNYIKEGLVVGMLVVDHKRIDRRTPHAARWADADDAWRLLRRYRINLYDDARHYCGYRGVCGFSFTE